MTEQLNKVGERGYYSLTNGAWVKFGGRLKVKESRKLAADFEAETSNDARAQLINSEWLPRLITAWSFDAPFTDPDSYDELYEDDYLMIVEAMADYRGKTAQPAGN